MRIGTVALVRTQNAAPAIVDFLSYDVGNVDQSFGSLSDTDSLLVGPLLSPTPGSTNSDNLEIREFLLESPNQFRLTWTSVAGRRYRVETRDSMSTPWVAIGVEIVADGPNLTVRIHLRADGQAYYRVARLD